MFKRPAFAVFCFVSLCLNGCAATSSVEVPIETRIARALPAVNVPAFGQTVPVGTANDDAADDPAIWRNAADPAKSLIIGTDKKAGIYVYDLAGQILDFNNAGRVNNVDLRDSVNFKGTDGASQTGLLVVASDRNDLAAAKLSLFGLLPGANKLIPLGSVAAGAGEAYGVCLYRQGTELSGFSILKDGTIHQIKLDLSGATPAGTIVRSFKLKTQSEGCVVDEATGRLYVAEEDVGLWRFDLNGPNTQGPKLLAAADGKKIVADAEGVALADEGAGKGYILVSSQGDNAYTVFRRSDESYVGRFRIAGGPIGSTEETDGIELITGNFGPEAPAGLFIAQDGFNAAGAQNFKLVSWAAIKAALRLE